MSKPKGNLRTPEEQGEAARALSEKINQVIVDHCDSGEVFTDLVMLGVLEDVMANFIAMQKNPEDIAVIVASLHEAVVNAFRCVIGGRLTEIGAEGCNCSECGACDHDDDDSGPVTGGSETLN